MTREVQATLTPTPRADAARPVLHFTGRADMEATALWLRLVCEACRDARQFPPQGYLLRLGSLMKTLEPPHDR